jgi:hypothetical protein
VGDASVAYLLYHGPALTWLDLGGTGVTDETARYLPAKRSLAFLRLSATAVPMAKVRA